MARSERQRAV